MTMEEVADTTNLRTAFDKVASNKGAPGPDRQTIDVVRAHLDGLLPALNTALLEGTYRPGLIRRVWIPKAGGGERGLGIPNVVDRIVQQAVHQVLSPHFEPVFHDSSHGFRPGRSCHTAINEARKHLERGRCRWVVDLDLEKFFDRVHHQRLLARLENMGVEDLRVIRLIGRMLKAKVVLPDGVVVSTEEGTPQGGPLSPLLSNVVLDELDRELARRGHRFVRYADDCNIYVSSERAGQRVMASVTRFIEKRLRLKVNGAKSAVARPGARHFVGFSLRISRDGTCKVILSKRSRERIKRKIVELTPRTWGQSLDACIERLNRYLDGWMGFFKIIDRATRVDLKIFDSHIRRRLRAIVLKQKKRKRHIFYFFRSRRISIAKAMRATYDGRRSLWSLSRTSAANKAMSSYWFDSHGLLRLIRLWKTKQSERVIGPAQQVLVPE
jgi:group II intron reverse transcriptase/maturase